MRHEPATERGAGRSQLGYNLIELLIAMALSSVIFFSITVLYSYQADSLQQQQSRLVMQRDARFAIDHLRRDLVTLGSNSTPNSTVDPLVCPKPSRPLRALSLAIDGYDYSPGMNPHVLSVAMTLFGKLEHHTTYRTQLISGSRVTLVDDGNLPATPEEWQEIFNDKSYLRLARADGYMMFFEIDSVEPATRTIVLASAPPRVGGTQTCGYKGSGNGLDVDVHRFVTYRIIADQRPGAPTDATGVAQRGLLVRERLEADGTTPTDRTVLAENAVELRLYDASLDMQPASEAIQLVQYPLVAQMVTSGGSGPLSSAPNAVPERLRAATVKLTLRGDVQIRQLTHYPRNMPYDPLPTYRFDDATPGAAPTVTLATRVSMPTLVARNL